MSDSRQMRVDEMKRLVVDAQSRIEQLSAWRLVVSQHDAVGPSDSERLWLLQCIDNRRAMMLAKIEQLGKGIEFARENAQPEIGALFIDGRKI